MRSSVWISHFPSCLQPPVSAKTSVVRCRHLTRNWLFPLPCVSKSVYFGGIPGHSGGRSRSFLSFSSESTDRPLGR